MNRTGYRVG